MRFIRHSRSSPSARIPAWIRIWQAAPPREPPRGRTTSNDGLDRGGRSIHCSVITVENTGCLRMLRYYRRWPYQDKHADGGDKRHKARNQERGRVGKSIHQDAHGEGKSGAYQARGQSTHSSYGGHYIVGKQVGRQRQAHGGPTGIPPQGNANERQRKRNTVDTRGGNAGQDRQATDGADPGARTQHRNAAANQVAGDKATSKVTNIGGDERHPGK